MKLILGERTSAYISKTLNAELKEIYLDDDSIDIQEELVRFIETLLERRIWTVARCPYDYDIDKKILSIYKYDETDDSYDYKEKTLDTVINIIKGD